MAINGKCLLIIYVTLNHFCKVAHPIVSWTDNLFSISKYLYVGQLFAVFISVCCSDIADNSFILNCRILYFTRVELGYHLLYV